MGRKESNQTNKLPLWDSVIVLFCCTILCVHSSFASSRWGRESWLLCLVCLPGVLWLLCGSSSRCHGFACSLWLWYFLIILAYNIWQEVFFIYYVYPIYTKEKLAPLLTAMFFNGSFIWVILTEGPNDHFLIWYDFFYVSMYIHRKTDLASWWHVIERIK